MNTDQEIFFFSIPYIRLINQFYYYLIFCIYAFLVISYNLLHCIFYSFLYWLLWIKWGIASLDNGWLQWLKYLKLGKDTKESDKIVSLNYFLNLASTKGKAFSQY